MKFNGEGLSTITEDLGHPIVLQQRPAGFELPSTLSIGLSYDFWAGTLHRISALGNFTANSFSVDQVGAGAEYSFKEMFMARVGYRYDLGIGPNGDKHSIYSGLSAGVTIEVPTKKDSPSRFAVDYAYLATNPFNGTHNFSLRFKV
jgi:hypothetical protein